MKKYLNLIFAIFGILPRVVFAEGEESAFQFFAEEAQVVSASRQPVRRMEAPATVYVVTSEDIKNSGAQNVWDALRDVPGVDILQTRTDQGEISIRGLDKPLSSRTLILLDGRPVPNTVFDFTIQESIPVTMQEIDRIEVVEGPASAIYGADAVNGVINIITKTPEQLHGGQVQYTGGERNTQLASYDYGRKLDAWSYKFGGGWNSMNQFQDAHQFASQAGKFNAFAGFTPNKVTNFSISGGLTALNTQTTDGPVGTWFDKGISNFARTEFLYEKTKFQAYWNHDHFDLNEFVTLNNGTFNSDTYNAALEQSVSLPGRHELVFGANYRHNTADSTVLSSGLLTQDLWSFYGEDKWDLIDHWTFTASGRVDRHPYTPLMFSPRGSLIYTPVPEHVFRLSAGTAFRNPTILENSISTAISTPNTGAVLPNPPFTTIQAASYGNRNLDPERMETEEAAYNGRFGPVETSLVAFHYRLRQDIESGPLSIVGMTPPTVMFQSTYVNQGDIEAWGGESGLKWHINAWLSSFTNYSYQYLHDTPGDQILARQSPRHKANAGVVAKHSGWTGSLSAHWVDKTEWVSVVTQPTATDLVPVNSYFLVDAHVGYAFSGRWQGLEAGVTAFNLLNHDHYELLPPLSATLPGQNGEIVKSRWTGTVSYKF